MTAILFVSAILAGGAFGSLFSAVKEADHPVEARGALLVVASCCFIGGLVIGVMT